LRRIRWAPAAADDLEAIYKYLLRHQPELAKTTVQRLYSATSSLKQMPFRGRGGQKEGTRDLLVARLPYIIVYGVEKDLVHIFRLLHTAQDRP
jgi:toxin ParE1/3/4